MKGSSCGSRPGSFVCPFCETDQLVPPGHDFFHCASCGGLLSGAMLETLQQIRGLPVGLGCHACECGHPEMRRLPDGVFHCPACGSEVLPLEAANERLEHHRGHRAGREARNAAHYESGREEQVRQRLRGSEEVSEMG